MFEIKELFYLDGKPFQIISGAVHYFRTVPEYWRDRLEKLVNMGCNTVETYVPGIFMSRIRGNSCGRGCMICADLLKPQRNWACT